MNIAKIAKIAKLLTPVVALCTVLTAQAQSEDNFFQMPAMSNVPSFSDGLTGVPPQPTAAMEAAQTAAISEAAVSALREKVQSIVELFNAQKYDEALPLLDETLAAPLAAQDKAFMLNLKGAIFTKKKDYKTAREQFAEAVKLFSDFFPARFNLCETTFLEGNYAAALKEFYALVELYPGNDLIAYKIFLSQLMSGEKEDASRTLRRIPITAESPVFYYATAAWEFKNNRTAKGLANIKMARELYPDRKEIFEETLRDLKMPIP